MLFKNHKKVDFTEDPIYLEHKDEFEKLIKGKKTVVITTGEKIRINATGYKERDRSQTIPVFNTVKNKNGNDDDFWIYCSKPPKILQNGEKEYDKAPMIISRQMNVQTSERDKLFYLLYLSGAGINGRIYAINEEKENDQKAAKLGEGARINYMIFDEYSPVTETTIRRIAKAFGVGNVDKLPTSKVKLLLKGIIDVADSTYDTYRDSKAFIQAINMDDATNIRAMVQEAIDQDRIKYDEIACSYFYCNTEGEPIKKIMNVDILISNDNMKRLNALCNLFVTNNIKYEELTRLLNYTVDDVDFSIYNYVSLKKFLADHGESGKGSMEEVVERATNLYNSKKNEMHFDLSVLAVASQPERKGTDVIA